MGPRCPTVVADRVLLRLPADTRITTSLDAGVREPLAEHLEQCWACEHYVGEMSVTVRLAAALPPEPLPPELESRLLRMFCTELRGSRTTDAFARMPAGAGPDCREARPRRPGRLTVNWPSNRFGQTPRIRE